MKYKTPLRVAVCAIIALITLAAAMAHSISNLTSTLALATSTYAYGMDVQSNGWAYIGYYDGGYQLKRYDPVTNTTTNLSATDTAAWANTIIESIITLDNGFVYTGSQSGEFGVYNNDTNVWTDLSATDTANWLGTRTVNDMIVATNGLIYFSSESATDIFGYYDNNTNVATRIITGHTSSITAIAPDNTGGVYIAGGPGALYYYDNDTGVVTNLSNTDTGGWANTLSTVYALLYVSSTGLLYTGHQNGKFGVYDNDTNVWTDLSDTDAEGWANMTSSGYTYRLSNINNVIYTTSYSTNNPSKFGIYSPFANSWINATNSALDDYVTRNFIAQSKGLESLIYLSGGGNATFMVYENDNITFKITVNDSDDNYSLPFNVTINSSFYNISIFLSGNGTVSQSLIPFPAEYNITIKSSYYDDYVLTNYDVTSNLSALMNASGGRGDVILNVSSNIQNFTIRINSSTDDVTKNRTSTNYVLFSVDQNTNYTITYTPHNTSYAIQTANKNMTDAVNNVTFTALMANNINITIVDDTTLATLTTQNISLSLQSPSILYTNWTNNGTLYLDGLIADVYNICGGNENYTTRCYTVTITERSTNFLTMRLHSLTNVFNYSFYVRSTTNIPIADTLVTFQQQYGANWLTIGQAVTDNNGYAQISLQDSTYYKIIVDAPGYTLREITKTIYAILSGEVYYITPTGYSPFIPTSEYVEYYITPSTTRVHSGENNFSITTYSADGMLAWTAVWAESSLTNLTSSSTGGTVSILINVTDANTPLAVTYAYRVTGYDATSWTYYYTILANNETESGGIEDIIQRGSTAIPSQSRTVWMAIISLFLVAIVCITILELTDNRAASAFCGLATLGTLAAFGWLNIPVTALCVLIIIGYMVMS